MQAASNKCQGLVRASKTEKWNSVDSQKDVDEFLSRIEAILDDSSEQPVQAEPETSSMKSKPMSKNHTRKLVGHKVASVSKID